MSEHHTPQLLGSFSTYLSQLRTNKPLSFSNEAHLDPAKWRAKARQAFDQAVGAPQFPAVQPRETASVIHDGLEITTLEWQLPFGWPTEAYLLKPAGSKEKLPGVLALHDHGANKVHGKSKLVDTGENSSDIINRYRDTYYGGRAWANELAKRGYAVLVHDIFPFESRRIRFNEVPGRVLDHMFTPPDQIVEPEVGDTDPNMGAKLDSTLEDSFSHYNTFAIGMENVIAKAIFASGTTWPGIMLSEDRIALSVLASHPLVDANRLACCGLSLGGLRSNLLGGTSDSIRFSASIGFMTTWNDLIMHNCIDHTWMLFIPRLPESMDFPDILSMRAPMPSMVIQSTEDPLFTLAEVKRAEKLLKESYRKAGDEEAFTMSWYPGGHRFDREMQEQVFTRCDRLLQS